MKKGYFLWSAHRITERQKAGKARSIKGKQLKNSRSTVWRLLVAHLSSASADLPSKCTFATLLRQGCFCYSCFFAERGCVAASRPRTARRARCAMHRALICLLAALQFVEVVIGFDGLRGERVVLPPADEGGGAGNGRGRDLVLHKNSFLRNIVLYRSLWFFIAFIIIQDVSRDKAKVYQMCTEEYGIGCMMCTSQQECQRYSWNKKQYRRYKNFICFTWNIALHNSVYPVQWVRTYRKRW